MNKTLTVCALVAIGVAAVLSAGAQAQTVIKSPYFQTSPTEAYLSGQAEIGKAKAAMIQAQAAVLKAQGDVATADVKTAESLQSARGKAIDNGVKAASVFYERRKVYDAFQAMNAKEPPTAEELRRYASRDLPPRPSAYELHQGKIRWPEILLGEEFTDARLKLDVAFARRLEEPMGPGSELVREAREGAADLRAELRRSMDEFSPAEYVAARKFIDSLELEIQLPPQMEGVAAK